MNKKNSFILVSLLLIVLVLGYLSFFKKDTFDTQNSNAVEMISAESLISFSSNDKDRYTSLYINKVIVIEGIIKDINYINNRHTILLGGDQEKLSLVICDMQINQTDKTQSLKQGDTVLLKGVFKGFLKDAVFLNCVLSTN